MCNQGFLARLKPWGDSYPSVSGSPGNLPPNTGSRTSRLSGESRGLRVVKGQRLEERRAPPLVLHERGYRPGKLQFPSF